METLAYDNTKPWGDKLYEEEQTKVLQMSRAEWITYINAAFARLRGNGAALIQTLAWATQMGTPEPAPEMDEDTRNWRVWKDMVEEPSKYGSDIGEWLQLDEEVRRGPKRWRVDAYWNAKVREIQVREAEAATKIQALWRGIQSRQHFACGTCDATPLVAAEWDMKTPGLCRACAAATKIQALWRGYTLRFVVAPRFTCSRCLTHGVCPTEGMDRMTWFCAECTGELWGEVLADTDPTEVCDDCGDEVAMYGAKMGELWLCPACIHDWTTCTRCDRAVREGTRCDNHCVECGDELTGLGQTNGFCSGDCAYAYRRDSWRDSY
jgi:hypothetical protein